MAPAKSPARKEDRAGLLRAITTPLGFFVLALLIVEATLTVVLTFSKLSEEHVWAGFLWMLGVFIGELIVVTGLTIWNPKNLLYGKEEHYGPSLELSALKDQIEDLIAAGQQPKTLKSPEH